MIFAASSLGLSSPHGKDHPIPYSTLKLEMYKFKNILECVLLDKGSALYR